MGGRVGRRDRAVSFFQLLVLVSLDIVRVKQVSSSSCQPSQLSSLNTGDSRRPPSSEIAAPTLYVVIPCLLISDRVIRTHRYRARVEVGEPTQRLSVVLKLLLETMDRSPLATDRVWKEASEVTEGSEPLSAVDGRAASEVDRSNW